MNDIIFPRSTFSRVAPVGVLSLGGLNTIEKSPSRRDWQISLIRHNWYIMEIVFSFIFIIQLTLGLPGYNPRLNKLSE